MSPRGDPEPPAATRVVVVDDHRMIREGLRSMLEGDAALEIVGDADDERSAMQVVTESSPDVVLLDANLDGRTSFGLCGTLLREHPGLTVVFISAFENRDTVARARRAGAMGFLLKGVGPAELVYSLHRARQGRFVLDPRLVSLAGGALEDEDPDTND